MDFRDLRLRLFFAALTLLVSAGTRGEDGEREVLRRAVQARSGAPWPRGEGHVVLAVPGSSEDRKAYHEPGGSFSPAFGSFGVSFWVVDSSGKILTTSDWVPTNQIRQKLTWPDRRRWPLPLDVPGVETVTPYYEARWSLEDASHWKLHFRSRTTNETRLVVRSVGPAGGPLVSLLRVGDSLFINDRWKLSLNPAAQGAEVIPPRHKDPSRVVPLEGSWKSEEDWGYAWFRLLPNQEYSATIEDGREVPGSPLTFETTRAKAKLTLPDSRFVESLDAQVAHLMMGLVRNETRPGDPNNYPLNWLRDGAYVITALTRAGQLDVARQLSEPFAYDDFFGGFGSEGDAPGLALWTLGEVSAALRDKAFDEWLWPHVRRKVDLIFEMLSATGPVRKSYLGPIVPAHAGRNDLDLVCDASREGLIVGRMDWHRPLLFVNAVTYRGLLSAAKLAERVGGAGEAAEWRARAAMLREAWNKGLREKEAANERTFICGLHPTWVVSDHEGYLEGLKERRTRLRDGQGDPKDQPLWTYFTAAEAHQWLLAGKPAEAWQDLEWFWKHQASAGLYTWWEGRGEENTFGRWARSARGWLNPPHVTPHYWTAAEVLLLQLDMLTAVDESGTEPVLVVGAGVPGEWLKQPLSVRGIQTSLGQVDWEWNRRRVTVQFRGQRAEVRLGPAFEASTPVRVR